MICAFLAPAPAAGATLEPIGSASYMSPTYVTSDPSDPDRLFITEQPGTIRVTTPAGTALFLDLTDLVLDGGERGLWSMAFAPDFAQSGLFYVAYSANDGALTLDEYAERSTPAETKATRRPVLAIANNFASSNHNGGQLQFGSGDDYLYWSTGEDANPANSQTLGNLLGKILRIDPHGSAPGAYSVPPGNPFVGVGGAQPEIWAWGLRNPWRFSFDRQTGQMFIGDVGGGGWEEVDLGSPGANYGWNTCEGLCTAPHPELTNPIYAYLSDDVPCNAIDGGYLVRDPDLGDLFGRYLFTDLCGGNLRSIDPSAPPPFDTYRDEGMSVQTPVSFGEDACGRIYVVAQGGGGQVFRIEGPSGGVCPPEPPPVPQPDPPDTNPPDATPPDTTPPETTLRLEPRRARSPRAVFRIASDEAQSTLECDFDRRGWKPCGERRRLKHLEPGRHRFRARATDAAGNTDPTPARKRFKTRG